jgi:predicted transcriptional regulator
MNYRAIIRSELKQNILLSLLEGSKRLSELKTDVQTTETTVLHVLKEFENLGLTTKLAGVYSLSSLGLMYGSICYEFTDSTDVLEKFKDFWLNHDVEAIPSNFMLTLGSLKDSSLVKTESSELGKVHETFMQLLLNSKKLRGTSPIFHPDYVTAFRNLLEQGGKIELICTDQVLSKTLQSAAASDQAERFQKFIMQDHLKIYLIENLKIALTVTDDIFSLGLFSLNGTYDYNSDLISMNPEAVRWGESVFEDYLKKSKRIDLQDLG